MANSSAFSLDPEMIRPIFDHAKPLGHGEIAADLNLGFGFVYYGLVRALRPEHIVVIGSGYGFSVVCLALGLKDNRSGRLTFVDPSYSLLENGPTNTIGGVNFWRDPAQVRSHFARFGVEDIVTHYKQTSEDFSRAMPSSACPPSTWLLSTAIIPMPMCSTTFRPPCSTRTKHVLIPARHQHLHPQIFRHAGMTLARSKANRHKAAFEYVDFPFASGVAVVRVLEPKVWKQLS